MMPLEDGVFRVESEQFARVAEVWEASVRATHQFVAEADIVFFRPLVRSALRAIPSYCVQTEDHDIAGFIAVNHRMVEMLFIDPRWRGQGVGKRLLDYAIHSLGATELDCNEQNEQALGFYLHQGFEVIGRSELDSTGKPYPILHMRLAAKT